YAAGGGAVGGCVVEVGGAVVGVGEVLVVHAAVGHAALAGHVVDDRVHVHLHPGRPAGGDHAAELRLGTHPAEQAVVHRLVNLPPGVQDRGVDRLGTHQRILRRCHLYPAVPGRAEHVDALGGDRWPIPLEQVGDHVVLAGSPSVVGGRRRRGDR